MSGVIRWILIGGAAWTVTGLLFSLAFGRIVGKRRPSPVRPEPAIEVTAVAPPPARHALPADVTVVLHGLVDSSFVVVQGLEAFRDERHLLTDAGQEELVASMLLQASLTHQLLSDLMTAAPQQLVEVLDQLTSAQIDYRSVLTDMAGSIRDGKRG